MDFDLTGARKIAEGKTKIIYENSKDEKTVYMYFKDDITAGDGLKHDIIEGKALVDWQTNLNIFRFLNRMGVKTHYISSPKERVSLVKKLDKKINLEVVTRRVATGSIVKWGNVEEGKRFDPVITQFYYKDDLIHDPMLDDKYIDYIIKSKGDKQWAKMREMNGEIFAHLESAFAKFDIQLVDIKLEYGIIDGDVHLIDEVTGGSLRLWPYAHPNPKLDQKNILSEVNPNGRLDKDTYRMNEDLDRVKEKFEKIAQITEKFEEI